MISHERGGVGKHRGAEKHEIIHPQHPAVDLLDEMEDVVMVIPQCRQPEE